MAGEGMDNITARYRLRKALCGQLQKYSMKRITLARLTGVDSHFVAEWLSGDASPSHEAFQRLKEIFRLTDVQLTGRGFQNKREYNSFFAGNREG